MLSHASRATTGRGDIIGGRASHLFADISTFLRSQLLQPISLDLIEVALDSGLERLVLPDGRRAEGAACELTWR